ncbi:DUF6286 domain-containing protein [Isoptericola sp. NPDC019693]|uniref:DUF6286 domain-containing protein n=1 Tax=Isoptericola sp. NPDC019693 TaxID=3364009 RepID=UPI0037B4E969
MTTITGTDGTRGTRVPVPAAPGYRSGTSARAAGVVVALVLIACGVAAAQEALAARSLAGLTPEDGWVRQAVLAVEGSTLGPAAVLAGVVAALVGIVVLVAAWRGNPRAARLRDAPAVELRPRDVARLSSATAQDVDGVLAATSTASRRTVVVRVTSTGDATVPGEVAHAVQARVAALDPTPQVRVRVTSTGGAA